MALNRLSRSKHFRVNYCDCTAAALLLNDQIIQDAIDYVRRVKTKRDFVKTTITILKDGVKIMYNDNQQFSTTVPSTMIAASAVGRGSFEDTVGVVYISPLNGQHYPAFIHIYQCDSSRSAQKLLTRFRSFLLVESYRLQLVQLEKQLLNRNLLNIDNFNARKSQKNTTNASSSVSSTNSDTRQEKKNDPIKSITEELQKKINAQEPILYPPKDYDTLHVTHGNIHRAQAWRSTQPTIVGYSSNDQNDSRVPQYKQSNVPPTNYERKNQAIIENNNEKSRLSTQQKDATMDPVETVSLAFDFLKDETGSIFTENEGNTEHVQIKQPIKNSPYRFQVPQMTAVTKNLFSRNNNYELSNGISQSNASSRNDLDFYNNNNNNNNRLIQNGYRARSEMRLDHDQQPNGHHNRLYEGRVGKINGPTVMMNPIWAAQSSNISGSQPNLLSSEDFFESTPVHHQPSPQEDTRTSAVPVQNFLYASYPDNKPAMRKQENQQKKIAPTHNHLYRKQAAQSQYLDTNEFILRASNGQPLRNSQYPNRHVPREYRPHSMHDNVTMLDVYY